MHSTCVPRSGTKGNHSQERGPIKLYQLICSWCFCSWNSTNSCVIDQEKFFRALGQRIRALRKRAKYSQEDMISFGFSARHWQQIEAGRPITLKTLVRASIALRFSLSGVLRGLKVQV